MQTVNLGRTGVGVSQLCLGTMSFGTDADEAESARLYAASREAGISFFDCANIYGNGVSETILGRLIAHERDQIVLTSKCYFMGGLSRMAIRRQVEDSLRRLDTDRLDILFLHHSDDPAHQEDQLRALEDLARAGKAIYLGASNHAAWQIARALGIADKRGWSRLDVIQPMYSLVKRQAEVEILPLAQAEDIGVISYSPLGGGLLSGKYARGEGGRLTEWDSYKLRYGEARVFDTAAALADMARDMGVHPVSLAVAWAGAHPGVTAPIIGARSVQQLRPSLDSVDIDMTPELYARIEALSARPAPATDRLDEQVSGPG